MVSNVFALGKQVAVLLFGLVLLGMGGKEIIDRLNGPLVISKQQLLEVGVNGTSRLVKINVDQFIFDHAIGSITTVRKKYGVETSRAVTSQFFVAMIGEKLLLVESEKKPDSTEFVGRFEGLTEEHRTKILDDVPAALLLPYRVVEVRNFGWTGGMGLVFVAIGVVLLAYAGFQLRKLMARPGQKAELDPANSDAVPPFETAAWVETNGIRDAWNEQPQNNRDAPSRPSATHINDSRQAPKSAASSGPKIGLHVKGQRPGEFIAGNEIIVGRSQDCDLPLVDDIQASKRHASLTIRNGVLVLRDLGSSNGTFLNGSKINGLEPVSDGDWIVVGRSEIRVSM